MLFTYEPSEKLIVQHNKFINGKYFFSTNEMRIFVYMLLRLKKDMQKFEEVQIPCHILHAEGSSTHYDDIKSAASKLADQTFEIEHVDERGRRSYEKYPLMAYCKYKEGSGCVQAKFNESANFYLLNLSENFTSAQFKMFMRIKSYYGYRMYWLLKQYEDFGGRKFTLDYLRDILMVGDKYKLYSDFKRRVIDTAMKDLKKTDMAFEYEEIKKGRKVAQIKLKLVKNFIPIDTEEASKRKSRQKNISQVTIDFGEDNPTIDKRIITLTKLGFSTSEAQQIINKSERVRLNRLLFAYEQQLEAIAVDQEDVREEFLSFLEIDVKLA